MMLTVKKAAETISASPALVYALCAQGKLECARIGVRGGAIRILEESLSKYLRESMGKKTDEGMELKHIQLPPEEKKVTRTPARISTEPRRPIGPDRPRGVSGAAGPPPSQAEEPPTSQAEEPPTA